MSAAVAASQPARQGSYFRRQASLPFPGDAQTAAGEHGVQATATESQTAVIERLVPDYDWQHEAAMSDAAGFGYHFSNVADMTSVVAGDQVNTAYSMLLHIPCFIIISTVCLHVMFISNNKELASLDSITPN